MKRDLSATRQETVQPEQNEPLAKLDWRWQHDIPRKNGVKFTTLTKGDKVWPQPNDGPRPMPRQNWGEWQYGLNITTSKYGWYSEEAAEPPAPEFLRETPPDVPKKDHGKPQADQNQSSASSDTHS